MEDFFMPNVLNFFNEVSEELKKVTWPSRNQTIKYTILVIIVTISVGVFLGGLDFILVSISNFLVTNYGR
jgi:preprotein translocase subunit SecE